MTFSGTETNDCRLEGFKILFGDSNTSDSGGITGNGTEATITDCMIISNSGLYGGGINNCDGIIQYCTINGNYAYYDGGGLYKCDGIIKNCNIFSIYTYT